MRQRSIFGFLAASLILLFVVSIAGCQNPLSLAGGNILKLNAAIFVSKTAPVMVSIVADPNRLQALEGKGELSKLKTGLLANTSIDYEEDIKPWLGNEITLAVTTPDIDHDLNNGQQPGYLMVLATQKPEKSREFVDIFFSKRVLGGGELTVEQYQGVKLISDNRQGKSQNHLAGAVVGDNFVLFANDLKVLREAINNVQAFELNLTSSSKYQQAVKELPQDNLAVAFLNLKAVSQWQKLNLAEPTYDSQIVSVKSKAKVLLLETALLAQQETLPALEEVSENVAALQYIPAQASLVIAGSNLSSLSNSNLAQLWKQATTALFGSTKDNTLDHTFKFTQSLADAQKKWGINLQEDIFSWVQGEYALGLLTRSENLNPEWIFVAQKSPQTPLAISHLDTIASKDGLSVNTLTLETQKIFTWTQLTAAIKKGKQPLTIDAKVYGAHTSLGNYEVFTSSIEAMNEVLMSGKNSLVNNRDFQDSIAAIPQPNQGYVYIDWTKSQDILEQELPILKFAKVVAKPLFDQVRAIAFSSYPSKKGALKGGVFLRLD